MIFIPRRRIVQQPLPGGSRVAGRGLYYSWDSSPTIPFAGTQPSYTMGYAGPPIQGSSLVEFIETTQAMLVIGV